MMTERRPIKVGDRVRICPGLVDLEHYAGKIGEVILVIPQLSGICIGIRLDGERIHLLLYEPPEKVDIVDNV